MRPTDALIHRRALHEFCSDKIKQPQPDGRGRGTWEIQRDIVEITGDSSVYFVSEDMTAVAKAAAKTMPRQELRRDDLPSERGFMVFDQPVCHWELADGAVPIVGFAWIGHGPRGYSSKHPDLECTCPFEGSDPHCAGCADSRRRYDEDPNYDHLDHVGEGPDCICPGCTCPASEPVGEGQEFFVYPLGRVSQTSLLVPMSDDPDHMGWMQWIVGDIPSNDFHNFGGVLLATWTLMQQSLSVSQKIPGDRAERRRCSRANLPSDVVVVRLRRHSQDNDNAEAPPEGAVAWSHRWLVNGHWRNQWLPSRAAHRLQWIAGYVKGPAKLPLIVKDRVTAWVR